MSNILISSMEWIFFALFRSFRNEGIIRIIGYDGMVIFAIFAHGDVPPVLAAHKLDQHSLCHIYKKAVLEEIKATYGEKLTNSGT